MLKAAAKYSKFVFFLLGLGVFLGLIHDFGINNILTNLSRTGWWLIPIIGIWAVVYLLNSLSFWVILGKDRYSVGFRNSMLITISGFAINYITPFASVGGEPFRIFKLRNYISTPSAVSKVVLCKMVQLFSHFILWLVTILIMFLILPLSENSRLILAILFSLILAFSQLFISSHKNGLIGYVYSGVKKLRIKPLVQFFEKRERSIYEADENIKELYNRRKEAFYLALSFEFLARIVSSLEFYFILRSIGLDASVLQAIYINSVSSLFMNIFFFVPLELGIREGSLLFIMKSINITAGIGIFIAVINRIRELFWIITGLVLIRFIGKDSLTATLQTLKRGVKDESIAI
ncbi:MAG: flippase-like domain-containing protein [Ignavibacteria bacterium]|jgi:uncharacterized membrane protein YbhN (UPF0104 family)|nr:flippase-like domain-containing protein [Ignavibacteria bacterium]MCU7502911.1 flippase-like domain-containing protein [Ignavibacteria bacterium]MCU7515595.1 flippase-like domain-containing protein [Ignavibacteria bacterium]